MCECVRILTDGCNVIQLVPEYEDMANEGSTLSPNSRNSPLFIADSSIVATASQVSSDFADAVAVDLVVVDAGLQSGTVPVIDITRIFAAIAKAVGFHLLRSPETWC